MANRYQEVKLVIPDGETNSNVLPVYGHVVSRVTTPSVGVGFTIYHCNDEFGLETTDIKDDTGAAKNYFATEGDTIILSPAWTGLSYLMAVADEAVEADQTILLGLWE